MADVRFEVFINGVPTCIAGVNGHGAIHAIVDRIRRTTKQFEEAQVRRPDLTLEEFTREEIEISVSAHNWVSDHSAHWLRRELVPGDEVTINVLGPGPVSSPENTVPSDVEWT